MRGRGENLPRVTVGALFGVEPRGMTDRARLISFRTGPDDSTELGE